jgi:hypothetical protein
MQAKRRKANPAPGQKGNGAGKDKGGGRVGKGFSDGAMATNVARMPLRTLGSEDDGLDDNGDAFEDYSAGPAAEPEVNPRDLKLWLRPPALVRVPLHGRLVPMHRYGQRRY